MEFDSLQPVEVPSKPVNVWRVATFVFLAGLGAGMYLPSAISSLKDFKASSSKHSQAQPLPNEKSLDQPEVATEANIAKIEKVDAPAQTQAVNKPAKAEAVDKNRKTISADPSREIKKNMKKKGKQDTKLAKSEKTVPAQEKARAKGQSETLTAKSHASDLIEEVPSALTAAQVEKLMQSNKVTTRNTKSLARQVSLPPEQNMNQAAAMDQSIAALPILKRDPRGIGKTYPVSYNNASFSKANLASCKKRCALPVLDALGKPIKAIIDGSAYAASLMQHNGTINISGQPRIVKNQQVLVVENITFNLSSSQPKSVAARSRAAAGTIPAEDKAGGYTEVSFEGDDLKPGTVIKSRKQIPLEEQQEISAP